MNRSGEYYFEDLCIGYTEQSPGRTVTEYDIGTFAGLSGDYNQLHTDAQFASQTMFEAPIAHGLLGLTIASGLYTRTELGSRLLPTTIALMGVAWDFVAPIYAGDTVRLSLRLDELTTSRSGERGVVVMHRSLTSDRSGVVQQGHARLLIARRRSESAEPPCAIGQPKVDTT